MSWFIPYLAVILLCVCVRSHIHFSFPSLPHSVGVGLGKKKVAAKSDCDRMKNFHVRSGQERGGFEPCHCVCTPPQGTGLDRDLAKRYPVLFCR